MWVGWWVGASVCKAVVGCLNWKTQQFEDRGDAGVHGGLKKGACLRLEEWNENISKHLCVFDDKGDNGNDKNWTMNTLS